MDSDRNIPLDLPFLDAKMQNCNAGFSEAAVLLFGAPFDGTSSFRPGSRFGPAAMRQDSSGLETYSPYQDCEMAAGKCRDLGDLELPPGGLDTSLERIGRTVRQILAAGKKPAMLGGEHLVTLPSFAACSQVWPDLAIIQFDAHADLRDEYLGERRSHATVMRRIWDIVGDGRIWQMGIRSGTAAEFGFARQGHVRMRTYDLAAMQQVLAEIGRRPVYLSIDLDVLDPSCFPGTGTPEPGGVNFNSLLRAVLQLRGLHLAAFDLVELAPAYDPSGSSTAAALKLLREILIMM